MSQISLLDPVQLRLIARCRSLLKELRDLGVHPVADWELQDIEFLEHMYQWLLDIKSGGYVVLDVTRREF